MSTRTAMLAFRTAAFLTASIFLTGAVKAESNRITSQIDGRATKVLAHHVSRRSEMASDLGPVEANFRLDSMVLLFSLSKAQRKNSEQLLEEQQNPSSLKYHHWLTLEEYADRFGLSPADIQKLTTWLESYGFRVEHVARGRDWIHFSGTAEQVERAFGTEIHRYNEDGELHFANRTNPTIPLGLANAVHAIDGLHDFQLKPHMGQIATPKAIYPNYSLSPDDLAAIYDLNPFYEAGIDGSGIKIAVIGQTDLLASDVAAFRSRFGLVPNQFQVVTYGSDPGVRNGDAVEAALDLEWAGAVARNATVLYVNSRSVLTSLREAIDNQLAPIITMSYGGCEHDFTPIAADMQQRIQKANMLGITVVIASGDSGAASCDREVAYASHGLAVSFPASIPEVTAIGGTELGESGPYQVYSYVPEFAWNDTSRNRTLSAGGGGASILFPKPVWQSGPGVPADQARDVPDIALTSSADQSPYLIYVNGSYLAVGGTSAATPVFAGILALINQYQLVHQTLSQPGLGNINPILYQLAQSKPSAFHDITVGDNRVPCLLGSTDCSSGTIGYSAGPGYDQATGLGSIDAFNLAVAWSSTPTTVKVQFADGCIGGGLNAGTTATAIVKAVNGSRSPTGTVTFFSSTGEILGSAMLSGYGPTAFASINILGFINHGGSINVYAVYGGDSSFQSSVSPNATLLQNIYGNATTIDLQVLPSAVPQGGRVGFVATVQATNPSCGIPTGSVDLFSNGNPSGGTANNGNSLATVALNSSGTAVFTAVMPDSGAFSITATYSGDGNFQGVTTTAPQAMTVISPNDPNFPQTSDPFGASRFVPITPCHVADTRLPDGPYGGPALRGQAVRDFAIPGGACGVPSNAVAYSLNVTVVPHGSLGWITVWPTGQLKPTASTLNSGDGRIKANAAIVPAGTAGAVSIFASDNTEVVLDINGYFVPAVNSAGLAFYPLPPCRVIDTRNAADLSGGLYLTAGQERKIPMLSSACSIPVSARAYSLNFTAIPHSSLSYLTVWPAGYTQPVVSTLNAPTGTVTANAAIVSAGQGGDVDVFATNDTDLVVDINGYFAPAGLGGLSLYSLPPCRVFDTRTTPTAQPFAGAFSVSGQSCNLPATAQSLVLNATVVPFNPLGFLTLWADTGTRPNASTLNAWDSTVMSNMALVPTSNGSIDVFASDPTHLILDISGYFAL